MTERRTLEERNQSVQEAIRSSFISLLQHSLNAFTSRADKLAALKIIEEVLTEATIEIEELEE